MEEPLTAQQIAEKRFTPVRLREGYSMEEVDHFLDEVQSSLKVHEDAAARLRAAPRSGLPVGAPPPEDTALTKELEATRQRLASALETSRAMELELERLRNSPQSTEAQLSNASAAAARTLEMAARQHDELIATAEARREEIMEEARVSAATDRATIEERMGNLDREEALVAARIQTLLEQEEGLRKMLVVKHSEALAALQAPSARVEVPEPAPQPATPSASVQASPPNPDPVAPLAEKPVDEPTEARAPLDVASNQFPSFYDPSRSKG